jgi:hypothetical protein
MKTLEEIFKSIDEATDETKALKGDDNIKMAGINLLYQRSIIILLTEIRDLLITPDK